MALLDSCFGGFNWLTVADTRRESPISWQLFSPDSPKPNPQISRVQRAGGGTGERRSWEGHGGPAAVVGPGGTQLGTEGNCEASQPPCQHPDAISTAVHLCKAPGRFSSAGGQRPVPGGGESPTEPPRCCWRGTGKAAGRECSSLELDGTGQGSGCSRTRTGTTHRSAVPSQRG